VVGGEDGFVESAVGQVEPGGAFVVEVRERAAGGLFRCLRRSLRRSDCAIHCESLRRGLPSTVRRIKLAKVRCVLSSARSSDSANV
jgi:hypothetical protein